MKLLFGSVVGEKAIPHQMMTREPNGLPSFSRERVHEKFGVI